MNAAKTIEEYTHLIQGLKKEHERTGIQTNFRRSSADASYFMTIGNAIRNDKIVRNEIVGTEWLNDHEAVTALSTGGWERV